ncbi:MAG TPA: sulfonate ABC transporter ATP-binding protein [Marinobacter sp.]|nr:sulfonate ABC transporter ATP-binding protein [Marinobacter sp.]
MSAKIALSHVGKTFPTTTGPLVVLDDINLDIKEGEFVAVVGASGCGKSTLLRLLMGLEQANAGQLKFRGQDAGDTGARLGIVFQDHRLFPWLTVLDNVLLGLEGAAESRAKKLEKARAAIATVGLSDFESAHPSRLSGGMAQRAAIARALVGSPDVLLMDEPFGALDAFTKLYMQKELLRIWQLEQRTTVLVTHDIEEAVFLADRIVVLASGPGRIEDIVPVSLERPRDRSSQSFQRIKDSILKRILGEH